MDTSPSAPFGSLTLNSPSSSTHPLPDSNRSTSPSTSTRPPAPGLDLSLPTAVNALVHHLTLPLAASYPHAVIIALRKRLSEKLCTRYAASWRPQDPSYGSGFRSLICDKRLGLPRVLRDSATATGVDANVWKRALAGTSRYDDEPPTIAWEAWCDPGVVAFRYGTWEYQEPDFDPFKVPKETMMMIWQATHASPESAAAATPARASHAIPIRAPQAQPPPPAVYAIPPTPAGRETPTVPAPVSPSLLPSADITHRQAPAHPSRSPSPESDDSGHRHVRAATYPQAKAGHGRSTGSTSSVSSGISDGAGAQLLTPATRPASAEPYIEGGEERDQLERLRDDKTPRGRDPSPTTPREGNGTPTSGSANATPTVTPYDNGNVTVLGGGIKLGGGPSRPGSVMSSHRGGYDRSRSPSISLASRALNTAVSPNGPMPGSPRKTRTRRRIMPTYLGHLGQPGVGGPVMGAFGQFPMAPPPPPPAGGAPWQGVGVGVAPPPALMPRMGGGVLSPRLPS